MFQSTMSANRKEGKTLLKCKICDRETITEYCELHEKAHESIIQKYSVWRRALEISWKEYLNEVIKNPFTGTWAKKVARDLLNKTKFQNKPLFKSKEKGMFKLA